MKESFNLTDKRKKLMRKAYAESMYIVEIFRKVQEQDKEFIRLLKEEIRADYKGDHPREGEIEYHVIRRIDKLAGDLK